MLVFAAALSLATGLLFGLFPALHSTRPNLVTALKANAGQPSGAKAAARFRVTLATAQIALSMALLVSAGLFTKSLLNISRVDLGLEREQLVVFGVAPAHERARRRAHAADARAIEDELSRVSRCGRRHDRRVRLISGDASHERFPASGRCRRSRHGYDSAFYNYVGPDYLRTLGIRARGRPRIPARRRRGRAESCDCQRGVPARNSSSGATRSASACSALGAAAAGSTSKSSVWPAIRRTTR